MNEVVFRGAGKPADVQEDLERAVHPDVMLLCDACQHERPHRFFGRQAVLPGVDAEVGWALMYQCVACAGTVRRWGLE